MCAHTGNTIFGAVGEDRAGLVEDILRSELFVEFEFILPSDCGESPGERHLHALLHGPPLSITPRGVLLLAGGNSRVREGALW